uniref:Uncharacterized protein n=1 Tax=Brassica oleracea TaxID=3712 RepID=A0A3P6CI29_BRAOL|nr:unnamed protein product [Brassica oleracea]
MASLFVHLFTSDVTKYLSFNAVDGSYVFVKGKVQTCHSCSEGAGDSY